MAKVSLRTYNREIESMLDGGLFQEAAAHSLHILKTYPKHLETYRLLGKAYLELKQYSDATDIFSRLLACVPNDFVAHVGMGIIRDEENKLDDAIWHMERAFETQPSNPAIQGELQRLYGRRDGSAPPRIRMTRGALAQMYLHGELYPQAISEIKGVLTEDPGRTDMRVLLARAHFRGGQKNEAAEVASSVLRRYPYCLDANRVLAEILEADRPDSAMGYRQRVYELDPYAAHVTGSIFQSVEAPESAIAVEKLDWNGQPVGMPSDWRESRGISLPEREPSDKQPDWLQTEYVEEETLPPTPLVPPVPSSSPPPGADDNIPDFLRQAGWQGSTSAFDESKSAFEEQEQPAIAAGDLPDWIKEMAPSESPASPEGEKEAMPDWMNRIDPGILGGKTEEASTSADQTDWLKDLGLPASASAEQPADETPDWLKELGATDIQAQPASAQEDKPDWLKSMAGKSEEGAAKSFESAEEARPEPPSMAETPATSEKDLDDSFAWLESLAAKQGATEGLLMKPEERLEQEPEWVKQAKSLKTEEEPPSMTPTPPVEAPRFEEPQEQPVAEMDDLGRTGQEQDDSFDWLENLAAKQGATEGLLTKPEDRLEQEPEWVKQAKETREETPPAMAETPPTSMDTAAWLRSLDEEEPIIEPAAEVPRDDTSMWLKGLEESDVKPEAAAESADDTAMWLKSLDEAEAEPVTPVEAASDLPDWMQNIEAEEGKPEAEPALPEAEVASDWQESMEQPVPRTETGGLPSWLRGLDQGEAGAATRDDLPAWLRDDTGEVVAEPTKIEPTRAEEWQPVEKTAASVPPLQKAPEEKPKHPVPKKKPAPKKAELPPEYREPVTRKGVGTLEMEGDPILSSARSELSRSNIPGALETYAKLIKKGRYLDEVIFDLREALYRYPVEVSIWQSLGDAYMRDNRLQDALDAYTKAEELLR